MKETRMQREKRQHRELMSNIIEVRQYDYTEGYKIVVKYASGATRTYKNEPSWFMEYIEDSWSIMQETFNVYGSYEQIHNNYKPVEFSTPEEVEETSTAVEHPQEYTSADTSINAEKVPTIFNTIINKADKLNIRLDMTSIFDTGCGKYTNHISEYCSKNLVRYFGRDKYNQPEEVNNAWINDIYGVYLNDDYHVFTSSNVLNVIKGENCRKQYIEDIMQYMQAGEKLYITVYEGNKSGQGKVTKKDCWQENRKLETYIPELQAAGFTEVTSKYGMLICTL